MIDLSKEISKALTEYTQEVTEGLEEAKLKVAKDTVKELKRTSPRSKGGGDYAKGWSQKKVGNARVVYNRTNYQLTHLLEKGHVKRGGNGRVAAIPHIRPAEQRAIDDYVKQVEKVIRG
jgi:NADPH-dependent glutamate synthase beta subunit-like oxidoreductase